MLIFLIDGFNLFHKIDAIRNSATPRRDLVHYIRSMKLAGSPNNKVVIVFDGHDNDELAGEREFRICFSGDGTADEVIKARIEAAKNKSQLVVVSDDHEIRDFARSRDAKVRGADEFLTKASRARPLIVSKDEKELSFSAQDRINKELERLWIKKG